MFTNTKDLINNLKNKDEDFEFYPTTNVIICDVLKDVKFLKDSSYYRSFKIDSILDIGAGNGKVLQAFKNVYKSINIYAIEKANTLQKLLQKNAYIIGTDFHQQTLIDKKMDFTFCNPPYKEFQTWTNKIIKETCSKYVYLVIPSRWINDNLILDSLKYRSAEYKIIGDYDFVNAEDRKARCLVQLIRIDFPDNKDDAFDKFFNLEFEELINKYENINSNNDSSWKFSSLVAGKDYVHNLVELYNADLSLIRSNYQYVQKLDVNIMCEFGVTPSKILNLLKDKLSNLKVLYWNEITSHMDKITDKLTSKKRKQILETLNKNGHVDFTVSNIYAVVLWILQNANNYIDEQLIDVYEECISKANCKNYKSNEKVFKFDRWRYEDEKPSHIYLDFRLVLSFYTAISSTSKIPNRDIIYGYRLSERVSEYLKDLLTVANTLGFVCNTLDNRLEYWDGDISWVPGKHQSFEFSKNGKKGVLFDVKAHLNGNIHLRLNQEFALALNVEFGRLKKWIHSKEEATTELKNPNAGFYYNPSKSILFNPFLAIEEKPIVEEVHNIPHGEILPKKKIVSFKKKVIKSNNVLVSQEDLFSIVQDKINLMRSF